MYWIKWAFYYFDHILLFIICRCLFLLFWLPTPLSSTASEVRLMTQSEWKLHQHWEEWRNPKYSMWEKHRAWREMDLHHSVIGGRLTWLMSVQREDRLLSENDICWWTNDNANNPDMSWWVENEKQQMERLCHGQHMCLVQKRSNAAYKAAFQFRDWTLCRWHVRPEGSAELSPPPQSPGAATGIFSTKDKCLKPYLSSHVLWFLFYFSIIFSTFNAITNWSEMSWTTWKPKSWASLMTQHPWTLQLLYAARYKTCEPQCI